MIQTLNTLILGAEDGGEEYVLDLEEELEPPPQHPAAAASLGSLSIIAEAICPSYRLARLGAGARERYLSEDTEELGVGTLPVLGNAFGICSNTALSSTASLRSSTATK